MYGITPMMEAMLRWLARYKYLTVSHILALEISKSKDKTRKYFLEMMKQKLVNRQIHTSVSESAKRKWFLQRTREEYLWYLTPKGARLLLTRTGLKESDMRYPKRPTKRLKNDYFHRVSTIFINISFDRWAGKIGGTERQFLVYYDNAKESKQRLFEAETRLDLGEENHFSPDVICGFKFNNEPIIFCLEVYNNDKSNYIESQLVFLFELLDSTQKIEQKLGRETVPRILVTLDNLTTMKEIIRRLKLHPSFYVEGVEELILFNLDMNVRESFSRNWVTLYWKRVDLVEFFQ